MLNFEKTIMKKYSFFFLILLASIVLIQSCRKKKELANAKSQTSEVVIPAPEIDKVIVDENFVVPKENGRFNLESMEMDGNLLKLKVSYSGGCEEHIFNLYSNKMYAKSYPPQITLFLEHIDNNDRCRAMIYKDLVFDVTEIQYPGTNQLFIRLNNSEEKIPYNY